MSDCTCKQVASTQWKSKNKSHLRNDQKLNLNLAIIMSNHARAVVSITYSRHFDEYAEFVQESTLNY